MFRFRRRPVQAALPGSTAEAVCRTAPCPVFVVHPDERQWVETREGKMDLRRLLVAYDLSNDSEIALRYGLSLAQEHQTEIHLLHVLPAPLLQEPEIRWVEASSEDSYYWAARRLQRAIPAEAHLWCRAKHCVRRGKPGREILDYAKMHEIDLICIGAQGADFGMGALFGSNVDRVLRQAPCPVLVTRPLKPMQTGEVMLNHSRYAVSVKKV
ncbi:MAG: universal stress protein [Pyrinomonadaceae bacterium MAG19_C2-C3]|nr:universal stress protein [Pyrinomonadaceae bacterium MAG19_C2-C3]